MKKKIIYCLSIIFAIVYLIIGFKIATKNALFFNSEYASTYRKVEVAKIISSYYDEYNMNKVVTAEAKVLNRKEGDPEEIVLTQTIDSYSILQDEVYVGQRVFAFKNEEMSGEVTWYADEPVRLDTIVLLCVVFFIFLVIFGRFKGINTIISLSCTCLAIFAVYVPGILSGFNIYLLTIITAMYIIIMTILIVMGVDKKALASALGCLSGAITTALLTWGMSKVLMLTGITDEHSMYLQFINGVELDLVGIIFGAITIGAIGAIMDVAISIASSLKEVYETAERPTFKSLVKSGINIGRDMMGTMSNTLVLAYIGSSLSVVLLLCAYNDSVEYLLNREMIIVEMLQALVGSFGILLTIPLTTVISSGIYLKSNQKVKEIEEPKKEVVEEKVEKEEKREMTREEIFDEIDKLKNEK